MYFASTLAPILLDIQVFPCTYNCTCILFPMATCSAEFCSYHLFVQKECWSYKQLPCTYNCTCILFPMATCSTEFCSNHLYVQRNVCTYKQLIRNSCTYKINFVRAKQIFLFVQSSCTCNCTCKGFTFYRGADTCTAHFCYGGFSRISGRSVYIYIIWECYLLSAVNQVLQLKPRKLKIN